MNIYDFITLMRMIYGRKRLDLDRIQKMGLLAVKIGQIHALRLDFLPPEKCAELAKLYRATIPIPSEKALDRVDRRMYSSIDEEPLASASVGQVYRARLRSGEEVVIKIVKRNFKRQFKKDVRSVKLFLRMILLVYPKLGRVFDPKGILDHIEEYTLRELDLRNEIEGQETLRKLYEKNRKTYDLSNLRFPKVYKDLSSENVMVSEYVPGKTFDELLEGDIPYPQLLELFKIHGFYMFNIGTFHGDIHPGNIMLHEGKIYFIDTGAIGYVSKRLSHGLLDFFDALSQYDYEKCAEHLNRMAVKRISGKRFGDFLKGFREVYSDFKGKSVTQVSLTRKMMETIRLGVNSGMGFEKGMFSIIKSLMFLDGMVLRGNPDAVLLEDMRQYIDEFRKTGGNQDEG
jgi:ubiquinone biosynthesis protein